MVTPRLRLIGLVLGAMAVMTAAPAAQEPPRGTLQRFHERLGAYLDLRWQATCDLPLLDPAAPLPEFIPILERHIRAVRRARTGAVHGDVIDAQVAALMRQAIVLTLEERGVAIEELLAAVAADAPAILGRARVNDRLPWLRNALMPWYLVEALPPLPYEVQYRLVGRDLVLLDVELGLAIDTVRNVFLAR
jgi:hypothetical protein